MKKGIFLLASIAMLMLAGCGDSSGATSVTGNNSAVPTNDEVNIKVDAQTTELTTPSNLYNISDELGTPPALPSK